MAHRSNKWFPEFLKLHSPEHTSHRLRIPDAFVTYCNRLLPKKAVLSNGIGNLWHVDVNYVDNGVWFLDGWHKFVKDNSLECGDLLVFQYDGDREFSVKIFGKSACEKIESASNGAPYMNAVKSEEEEEEAPAIKTSRGLKQNNRGPKKRIVFEKEESAASYSRDQKNGGSKKLPDENLYFTSKVRGAPIRRSLYVPTKISKALNLSGHILFQNEHGEQWHGTVSKVKTRNHKNYITGWKSFCMSNQVGPDDWCICEFLQGSNEMGTIIQVHIFHHDGSES